MQAETGEGGRASRDSITDVIPAAGDAMEAVYAESLHPYTMLKPSTSTPRLQSDPDFSDGGDNQSQVIASPAPSLLASDHMSPYMQIERRHPMALGTSYPYMGSYLNGVLPAYGIQMFPHVFGAHSPMLLPSEVIKEEPVYVNAKQYNGIMRRRQSRAKAELENRLVRSRKPYLHESRHLHALRRARGCGGRFLNTKADDSNVKTGHSKSAECQSAQEGPIP